MKARLAGEVKNFQDIPNIGPAMEEDFRLLGLTKPSDLKKVDPLQLYNKLARVSGTRPDPCVLDTYLATIDFMNGAPARPWWYYTKMRKQQYPNL